MTTVTQLYDRARKGLKAGDAGYWQAAQAMAELYESGQTQQAIAVGVGCSQRTVSNYVRVWAEHRGAQLRPPFSEAMSELRDRGGERVVPKTPERRAELATELIKDRTVWETPDLRKQVDRHISREIKQAAEQFNRESGAPTRTETTRENRKLYPVFGRMFWRDLLFALEKANRMANEAAGELTRTGMPAQNSGDIVRAARTLAKSADRLAKAAAEHGIGKPIAG